MISDPQHLKISPFKHKILITSAKDVRLLEGLTNTLANSFLFRLDGLDLHAKIYFCARRGGGTDVFLGSANLTTAGALIEGDNVEMMACLKSSKDLISEFEKRFVYQHLKTKRPYPWLLPVKKEDFERSEKLLEQEEKLKELEDLRNQLSQGTFVLKRTKVRTWEIKWSGAKIDWPNGVSGSLFVGETGEPLNLEKVIKGQVMPKLTTKTPMAFLWIKLSKRKIGDIEFGSVAEIIGQRSSRGEDVWAQIVAESETVTIFKALLGEVRTGSSGGHQLSSESTAQGIRPKNQSRSNLAIHGLIETILLSDLESPQSRNRISKTIELLEKKKIPEIIILKTFWQQYEEAIRGILEDAS